MFAFGAQAVFMTLCGNRRLFLGDEAHLEWDMFRKANPHLTYCHGEYEIAWRGGSASAIVGGDEPGGAAPRCATAAECLPSAAPRGGVLNSAIEEMPGLALGAHWHHERYDGRGYPDDLAGESIPEEARIIAVADAYDAMTSNRSYRDAMPQEKVREQVERGRGTQFDPRFADIMLAMMDDDPDYRMRETRADG